MNVDSRILLELLASGKVERVSGRGSNLLTLANSQDIVVRKSSYVTDRTLMIEADKAAADLSRHLTRELQLPSTLIHIRLTAQI